MQKQMNLATALLAALLVINSGVDANSLTGRSLQTIPTIEDIKTSCRTKASVSAIAIGPGTVRAKGRSTCEAFASSVSTVENVVKDYYKQIGKRPGRYCTVLKIEKVLQTCAQSVAKAYASVEIKIDVTGSAAACVAASSSGDSFARSFASLFINMWIGLVSKDDQAEAEAKVAVLNSAIAKAWAAAKKELCQAGTGSVEAFEASFAKQVRLAIACMFVELTAKICENSFSGKDSPCGVCGAGELNEHLAQTESIAEANTCSKTFTPVDIAVGNASTGETDEPAPVPETPFCKHNQLRCCDPFFENSSSCLCGRGCLYTRKKDHPKVWEAQIGEGDCECP